MLALGGGVGVRLALGSEFGVNKERVAAVEAWLWKKTEEYTPIWSSTSVVLDMVPSLFFVLYPGGRRIHYLEEEFHMGRAPLLL